MFKDREPDFVEQWNALLFFKKRNETVDEYKLSDLEKHVERLAKEGNVDALYALAVGKYKKSDEKKFVELLEQAAQKGHLKAIRGMVSYHQTGKHGVSTDNQQAAQYLYQLCKKEIISNKFNSQPALELFTELLHQYPNLKPLVFKLLQQDYPFLKDVDTWYENKYEKRMPVNEDVIKKFFREAKKAKDFFALCMVCEKNYPKAALAMAMVETEFESIYREKLIAIAETLPIANIELARTYPKDDKKAGEAIAKALYAKDTNASEYALNYLEKKRRNCRSTVIDEMAMVLTGGLSKSTDEKSEIKRAHAAQVKLWLEGSGKAYKTEIILKYSRLTRDTKDLEELAKSKETDPKGEAAYYAVRDLYTFNDEKFIEYMKISAGRGYLYAIDNLVVYYTGGSGVAVNYPQAAKYIIELFKKVQGPETFEFYIPKSKIAEDVKLQNACILELEKDPNYKKLNAEIDTWFESKFIKNSDNPSPDIVAQLETDKEFEKTVTGLALFNPKAALALAIKDKNVDKLLEMSSYYKKREDLALMFNVAAIEAAKVYVAIKNIQFLGTDVKDAIVSKFVEVLPSMDTVAQTYAQKFFQTEEGAKIKSAIEQRQKQIQYKAQIEREANLVRQVSQSAGPLGKRDFLSYVQIKIKSITENFSHEASQSTHYPELCHALKQIDISQMNDDVVDSKFIQVRAILDDISSYVVSGRGSNIKEIWQACKKQLGIEVKELDKSRKSKGQDEFVRWVQHLVSDKRYDTMGKDGKHPPENIPKLRDAKSDQHKDVFEKMKDIIEDISSKPRKKEVNYLYEELQSQLKVELAAIKQEKKGEEPGIVLKNR